MSEPAGIVMPFAGSVAPEGWLLCDGSAVSRSEYADLFTAIGTTYGVGDGSTTFNVPDLAGRVVIGVSDNHALGSTGGEASHTLTESELPEHKHNVAGHTHDNEITASTPSLSHSITTQASFTYSNAGSGASVGAGGTWMYHGKGTGTATVATNMAVADHAATDCTVTGSIEDCAAYDTSSFGGGGAHNNLQPYQAVNYIISVGS